MQRARGAMGAAMLLAAAMAMAMGAAGGPGAPARGLILRLDAADRGSLTLVDGRVASWRSSAPGRAVTLSAEAARQPTLAGGAVRFDGRGQLLRSTGFGRRAAAWTLAAVVAADAGVRGGAILSACDQRGNDYDPGLTVDLFGSRMGFHQLSVEGAGRTGGQLNQMTAGHPPGGLHLVIVERTATEIRLRVDGVAQLNRPVRPATTMMDEVRIGARFFGGAEREFLCGRIARVLLYDRSLTPAEIGAIEVALAVPAAQRRMDEERVMREAKAKLAGRRRAPVVLERWADLAGFAATPTGRKTLEEARSAPVRTDLLEAIALSSAHLNSLFDRDRRDEPFFYSNRRSDGSGIMFHSVNIGIPHVVGRCILGSMMAERLAGVPFPPEGLATLERYLRQSFDNPDHLNSYYDPEKEGRRFVEFHNMREGLYGLVMLIVGRQSAWARETAGQMLATLDAITDERGEWSVELLKKRGMADYSFGLSAMNASRMVDPLLALHRATGDALALKLAGLYARASLRIGFEADGRFAPMDRSSGHVHSITSSLSGITEYALQTGDREMLERCVRILDHGCPEYFSSWGWGDEVTPEHPADEPSRGEMNQTGDVIRTCLHLGGAGRPGYYEVADRYLRSMVLPTQHREAELARFLHDAPKPGSDAERNVLLRTVGGWAMQLPNDRMQVGDWPLSTLDITSGTVHAMAEAYHHILTDDGEAISLNLAFDIDSPLGVVRSRLPLEGRIMFIARQDRPLRVRIPEWADVKSVTLRVNREAAEVAVRGGYLVTRGLRAGDQAEVRFPIPVRTERERVDGVTYRTTWAGSQILRITPRGRVSPLPW